MSTNSTNISNDLNQLEKETDGEQTAHLTVPTDVATQEGPRAPLTLEQMKSSPMFAGALWSVPMRALTIDQLLARDDPVKFLIDPLLPKAGSMVLGGAPGEGKSWLLMSMALALAGGTPWLGKYTTTTSTVLIIDEENPLALVKDRLLKLASGLGIKLNELPILFAVGQSFNLSDEMKRRGFQEFLRERKPDVVMLDSFVRVHRGEENSSTDISAVLAHLKAEMNLGTTFVFTHHTRKPNKFDKDLANSLRGSSDIRAFVDTQLALRKSGNKLTISQEKARWAQAIDPVTVLLTDSPTGGIALALDDSPRAKSAAEIAEDLILKSLADGPKRRKDIMAAAKVAKAKSRTVDKQLPMLVSWGRIRKVVGECGTYELVPKKEVETPQEV